MAAIPSEPTLSEAEWTAALRREVRRLAQWPAINPLSLKVIGGDQGLAFIIFDLHTERLLEPIETPILDVEPFALVYDSLGQVGESAPAIWSRRADFPRDIGHVNSGHKDEPASLCLARTGLQPIYDHRGIDGVIDRLVEWLHDAKTGQIMAAGWEPVPMQEGQGGRNALFKIARFQEIAAASAGSGWTRGIARLVSFNGDPNSHAVVLLDEVRRGDKTMLVRAQVKMSSQPDEEGVAAYVPWIFVWSNKNAPVGTQTFCAWNTLGEIIQGLKHTTLSKAIPTAIAETCHDFGDEATKDHAGGRSYILLLGIWRPKPIIEDVFGLSNDPEARRLEVRAFVLRWGLATNYIDDGISASQLVILNLPSREMLRYCSGIGELGSTGLIGYGALGSAIADFLVRSGVPRIVVVDKDTFEPHNIARHTGQRKDVTIPKVEALERVAESVTFFPDEIERSPHRADICKLTANQFQETFKDCPVLIDTTADERVRRHLSRIELDDGTRVCRVEIYHRGRLGVVFVAGPGGNPSLLDLYYELIHASLHNERVEMWLRAESKEQEVTEELLLGLGCASATVRMPKHVVTQHASSAMPTVTALHGGTNLSGFGINPLNERGEPHGWTWFDIPRVKVLTPSGNESWEVRISERVAHKLAQLREREGPKEVGGYLYGGFDFPLRQIYVVDVSDVPPGSQQSEASLILGPAGHTRLERQIKRRTGGKLSLVGTWHSHPSSDPEMSQKDRRTMERFCPDDRKKGIPTLLIVTSATGLGAYLWI